MPKEQQIRIEVMKKVNLTYDQGMERQRRWRKLCQEELNLSDDSDIIIDDRDLLNWLSMNCNIYRIIIKKEEI